mmetsp:Transcript_80349/g.215406  ORF Transcript_80349/g.215406 Transcript_80349/m.215406 type:complete len:85 (+) Transcript_80349:875-1129(+)
MNAFGMGAGLAVNVAELFQTLSAIVLFSDGFDLIKRNNVSDDILRVVCKEDMSLRVQRNPLVPFAIHVDQNPDTPHNMAFGRKP